MSTLTIRNLDPAVKDQLRVQAARHGRSMEAELRVIVTAAVDSQRANEPNLAEAIRRRFAPYGGIELESHPAVPGAEPLTFDP